MKKVIFGLIALAAISFSFSSGILDGEKQVKSSKVVWKGYKVLGSHEGTLNLKSGSLTFDNEILTGGEFVLDVTSISCTDLEGESKGQLEGHQYQHLKYQLLVLGLLQQLVLDLE